MPYFIYLQYYNSDTKTIAHLISTKCPYVVCSQYILQNRTANLNCLWLTFLFHINPRKNGADRIFFLDLQKKTKKETT